MNSELRRLEASVVIYAVARAHSNMHIAYPKRRKQDMNGSDAKTLMSDHTARFWHLLETEHVRILIDIRRNHEISEGGVMYHWDSASFSDDVAKALVAEMRPQWNAPGTADANGVPKATE